MRDAPRRRESERYRTEEWVAHGMEPAAVDAIVRTHARGRFSICAIRPVEAADGPLRAGFKAAGYRLQRTEPLMVHRLRRIPRCDAPVTIERVTTAELADALGRASRARPLAARYFDAASPIRQYAALSRSGEVVGWVQSITVGVTAWVAHLYVKPDHRRQGIGRAMMTRLLRDDREAGLEQSVLLASHTGALLYPKIGYDQIGELLLFCPRREKV